MQQMCGVNVIAYYSTTIFTDAGFSYKKALLFSLGAGLINFLGAVPGTLTIDRAGRRSLLLWTFPMMAACLVFAGSGFYVHNQTLRTSIVGTGIYVFMCIYSPGMGPVPFTYAAESYVSPSPLSIHKPKKRISLTNTQQPLEVRDIGMAFATAICWGFNFILALTFPPMALAFGKGGAFYFYGAFNLLGWVFAYFFMFETRQAPLEALDQRFGVRFRDFARWNWYRLPVVRRAGMPKGLEEVGVVMLGRWEGGEDEAGEKGTKTGVPAPHVEKSGLVAQPRLVSDATTIAPVRREA